MRSWVLRFLTASLFVCVVPVTAVAANTITATSSAELSNDPGFAGLWLYTVQVAWDLEQHDPGHFDIFLDVATFEDTCSANSVRFPTPAGQSDGRNTWGQACSPINYDGEFLCKPDPALKLQGLGVTLKYTPQEANCLTHRRGTGIYRFYTGVAPGQPSVHDSAVVVKHGQSITFGQVTGSLPGISGEPLAPPPIKINEFLVRPKPGDKELVEVFNAGSQPVSLDGWKIVIDDQFIIPLRDTIPAGGFEADSTAFPNNSTLIDFDMGPFENTINAGDVVNFAYDFYGVFFEGEGQGGSCGGTNVYANANQPPGFGSPPNVVSLCPPPIASDITESTFGVIRASFNAPAVQVCLDVIAAGALGQAFIRAYDANDSLIGEVVSPPGAQTKLCISDREIWTVRFSGLGNRFARFDNMVITWQAGGPPPPPIDGRFATTQNEVEEFLPDAGGTLQLFDEFDQLVDEVSYGNKGGAPTSAPLIIPAGATPPPGFRPLPPGGDAPQYAAADDDTVSTSTQRSPDGTDTGNDAEDWNVGAPSPDGSNTSSAQPPALGSSLRLNGVFAAGAGDDAFELFNPTGKHVDISGWHVSDGSIIQPLYSGRSPVLVENSGTLDLLQGFEGSFGFELDFEDVLYLYDQNLVRLDQLGWSRSPFFFPDSCIVRTPDGAGPADGYNFDTSGGLTGNLVYEPCALQSPTVVDVGDGARLQAALGLPAPNPTRGSSAIAFTVGGGDGERVQAELALYDVAGRRVRTLVRGELAPGHYRALWDGRDDGGSRARAGVYFVRYRLDGQTLPDRRSLVLLGQ